MEQKMNALNGYLEITLYPLISAHQALSPDQATVIVLTGCHRIIADIFYIF